MNRHLSTEKWYVGETKVPVSKPEQELGSPESRHVSPPLLRGKGHDFEFPDLPLLETKSIHK